LNVLNAPRKLSQAEFTLMQRHPILGFEQLKRLPDIPPEVLQGTVEHHEKRDGSGYPHGLAGDAISPTGRKVGVCDIYDALASERPYKNAMTTHKALGIMYQISDKEFHGEDIAYFIRMMGVYPVGSIVKLEDGWIGVVSASNAGSPIKPVVRLVKDPQGHRVHPEDRDLAVDSIPIATCLSAEASGISPTQILGVAG
jgi:HD-GYP domain-containing protein (c-di-GMP phosphodiesterase class II)